VRVGRLRNTAAPAPSPNSTQVLRSFQLTMVESLSAPMTSTVSAVWAMMKCWPISSAKRKPEQAASMSNAAAWLAPILRCTTQAVEGKGMSGVIVATMIKSICSGVTRARAMATSAALAARSEVCSCLAAMRRSLMPVRLVIHSSDVSTIFLNCSLVSTRSGT
jgi:hypothetical protein